MKKARPLTELTKKNAKWNWGSDQENSFKGLKEDLINATTLAHPNYNEEMIIHADASNYGLVAVLVQEWAGNQRPIAYSSRLLSKAERNYTVTEKECLAFTWARKKFNSYVWGSKIKFVTDHHALCWLLSKRELAGRLSWWALSLQEDYLTTVHKNGSRHIDADALSRFPIDNSEPTQSEEFDVPDDPYPMFMMHYVTDKGVDETGRTGSSEEQEINSKIREEQGKDEFIIKTIELLK